MRMPPRSILSAVDFSEQSRHALRWAGDLASRFEGRLTVLSVADPLMAEAARIRLGRDLATETERELREFVAATLLSESPRTAEFVVKTRIGEPASAILEAASTDDIDLIVMGTQGLGGFRKWLLGSVTERLLRRTRVPVLAVPPMTGESQDSSGDGKIEIVRILAATDFSESSLAAVKYAAELARHLSASLTLAHVVPPLTVPPHWQWLVQETDETRTADARSRLKSLADQFPDSKQHDVVVSVGRPADLIASIASDQRAQLIVMGLISNQTSPETRPGSIAYRVLSSAAVPVLVVPAQEA
jgi:nucleotide-binding universal stress UspA family protein